MNNKISVYDKDNFFELYQKLRSNPISLNEIIEKPTMLSLLPDLKGKKLLDLGCWHWRAFTTLFRTRGG
ncbi:SAM-dependent methyltransferase [Haemophilus influenzae]|uniref:SAM-dependent methyltransferase n=1 Tax=Haemophilus influenzae TaxID=727 RepID=A0A2X1RS09_HAEIF|nr:SAM-dependent methyltransferase [Haemophilus influenzae]